MTSRGNKDKVNAIIPGGTTLRYPTIVFWAVLLSVALQTPSSALASTPRVVATDEGPGTPTPPSSDNSITHSPTGSAADDAEAGSASAQQKAPAQTPKSSKPKPSGDSDRP